MNPSPAVGSTPKIGSNADSRHTTRNTPHLPHSGVHAAAGRTGGPSEAPPPTLSRLCAAIDFALTILVPLAVAAGVIVLLTH